MEWSRSQQENTIKKSTNCHRVKQEVVCSWEGPQLPAPSCIQAVGRLPEQRSSLTSTASDTQTPHGCAML